MTVTKLEGLKAAMNAARFARDDARRIADFLKTDAIEADAYATQYPDDAQIKYWRIEATYQLDRAKAVYQAAEAAYCKAEQAHNSWVEEMTYAATEVDDGELQ